MLSKWFTAKFYKGKLMTEPVVIEKTESLYDEMKVADKCTFSGGINKKCPVRT
jgi:hypothetical protein